MKATTVFVRLRVYSQPLKILNKLSGTIAGERLLYLSSCLVILVSYLFKKKYFLFLLISIFIPSIMEQPSILSFFAPKGELIEPPQSEHPILASSNELSPELIALV